MAKLIILSIVIVSFALPVWLSTTTRPRRTLRRLQWAMLPLVMMWAYMCLRWYPQIVMLQ